MKRQIFRGQITVFLSLVFVLILSFIGSMLQSAAIHINKSMKRADTRLALESAFAEYETEMLDRYDIFARTNEDERKMSGVLSFYGAKNMEHDIKKVRLLTDSKGQAFYEQAVQSMGGKSFTVNEVIEIDWEEREEMANQELEVLLEKEEQTLPVEGNPLETIKWLKGFDFLSLILPEEKQVSDRCVTTDELPSQRKLSEGTSGYLANSKEGIAETYLFVEYLTEHFPNYTNCKTEDTLCYEAEYILQGHETDRENLEAVFRKIFTIRMGINYAYLLTDYEKQSEAETLAYGLCSVLVAPEAVPVVKQAILFAWTYGESIQDLRQLAQGNRVATIKTKDSWQLSLEDVLTLGTTGKSTTKEETKSGMNYKDYIKVFLALGRKDELTMRALDLMELKTGIRVDECVTDMQIESTYQVRKNIKDTFITEYHYQ